MRYAIINIIRSWALMVALIILLFVLGCNVVKKTSQTTTRSSADTSELSKVNEDLKKQDSINTLVRDIERMFTETETSDTAIGLAGRNISLVIDPNLKVDTVVNDGVLSLHLYYDGDGRMKVNCNTDSFTLIVRKLTRSNTTITRSYDSVVRMNSELRHYRDSVSSIKASRAESHVSVKEEKKGGRGFVWMVGFCLLSAIVAIIIWELLKRFTFVGKIF